MEPAQLFSQVADICRRALYEDDKYDRFFASWPKEADEVPFYKAVYEDVFDCVEHWPRKLFSRETPAEWYRMDTYLRVYLDHELMLAGGDPKLLDECRKAILGTPPLTRDAIDSGIKLLLG